MYTSKEDKFQLLDKAIQFHDGNSIIAVSIVCLGLTLFFVIGLLYVIKSSPFATGQKSKSMSKFIWNCKMTLKVTQVLNQNSFKYVSELSCEDWLI